MYDRSALAPLVGRLTRRRRTLSRTFFRVAMISRSAEAGEMRRAGGGELKGSACSRVVFEPESNQATVCGARRVYARCVVCVDGVFDDDSGPSAAQSSNDAIDSSGSKSQRGGVTGRSGVGAGSSPLSTSSTCSTPGQAYTPRRHGHDLRPAAQRSCRRRGILANDAQAAPRGAAGGRRGACRAHCAVWVVRGAE